MSTFAVPSAGPTVTRFSAWSLTAKLTLAATVLCVLCVGTVSSVIGWQMSDMARDDAAKQADLAANEVAVAAFLSGQTAFTRIAVMVEQVLARYAPTPPASLAELRPI